ncbi:hypothetical protein EG68_00499 [Paragonimus skrjabini miyazakii]|uniref:ZMYM2-like/QRICH1 C-terminal domain-containing protein n=1 Tax=Paragonimus skrjabini miyazakii TaxID=59628 RepID=A0A8S9Z986_9TREM|nr:hypothetical protein EG68_00499 [Paragonimus skrjabini miyazakii]
MSLIKHCPLPSSSTTHKCHMEQLSSARSPPSANRDSNHTVNLHSTFLDEADVSHAYFVRMDTDSGLSDNLVNTSNADDSGAGALLDDALSAAMEAIAEANRLNESAESETGLGSIDTHTHHHLPVVSLNSSFGSTDKLDPDMEIQAHSPSGDMFSNDALVFDYDKVPGLKEVDYVTEMDAALSVVSNDTAQGPSDDHHVPRGKTPPVSLSNSLISHVSTVFHINWRSILRPVFEKALVERLWNRGELGASGPQALLLSLWFIISRHFGIGCRTEHARLVYGNLCVGTDLTTGLKQLQFFRTLPSDVERTDSSGDTLLATDSHQPDQVVAAQPTRPERCPVRLFEIFCSRRPFTINSPTSPLYLQPERNAALHNTVLGTDTNIIWYSTNALGKNKIGSMLNMALQNIGMPIGHQINLVRFCDALAAAALTPAGGRIGLRLAELTSISSCKHTEESMLGEVLREMEACADYFVSESTTVGSPVHQLLIKACALSKVATGKTTSKNKRSGKAGLSPFRSASDKRLTPIRPATTIPLESCQSADQDHLNITRIVPTVVTHRPQSYTTTQSLPPMTLPLTESLSVNLDSALTTTNGDQCIEGDRVFFTKMKPSPEHAHGLDSKQDLSFDSHNVENQQILTQMFQDTSTHILQDSDDTSTGSVPSGHTVLGLTGYRATGDLVLRSASDVVARSASHLPPTMVLVSSPPSCLTSNLSRGLTIRQPVCVRTTMSTPRIDSTTASISVDENVMNISSLPSLDHVIPFTIVPATSNKPASVQSTTGSTRKNHCNVLRSKHHGTHAGDLSTSPINDDIRIDLHKSNGAPSRSVRLEIRELLDLVLATSKNPLLSNTVEVHREVGLEELHGVCGTQRLPVGLVTQLLWRARALDGRGPWILTFAMWWLMQHYFGIGSRMHHVRLRWKHLRLVSGVQDPMTGEVCEAVEYVGPAEFTTVKACALVEPGADSLHVRRVYPSSGWAEAEITIASALISDTSSDCMRFRPLHTSSQVPVVSPRSGPNFVALYKAFAERRQQPSLLDDAPFYVQPLQSSSMLCNCKTAMAWFSVGALGKNRIGALMRNIVDKVVRPNLPRVAVTAAISARKACVAAIRRVVHTLPTSMPGLQVHEVHERRQAIANKLAYLLDLNVSTGLGELLLLESPVKTTSVTTDSPRVYQNPTSLPVASVPAAPSNMSIPCSFQPEMTNNHDPNSDLKTISINDFSFGLAGGTSTECVSRVANHGIVVNHSGLPHLYQPSTKLILLTSTDGSSQQLVACQSSLQSMQTQQLQLNNQQQSNLIFIPTVSGNALVPGTNLIQVNPGSSTVQHHLQDQFPTLIPVSSHQPTLLTTSNGQLFKTQLGSTSTMQPRRTVAYLTCPSTSADSASVPVKVILLSADNTQLSACGPSIKMVTGLPRHSEAQPVSQCSTTTSLTLGTGEHHTITTPHSGVYVQGTQGENQRAVFLQCADESPGIFDTETADTASIVVQPNNHIGATTRLPLEFTQLFYENGDAMPELGYGESRLKPEHISPTVSLSSHPPAFIQTITADGQLMTISSQEPLTFSQDDRKPQIFAHSALYSHHTDNLIDPINGLDSGSGTVLACYEQSHSTSMSVPAPHSSVSQQLSLANTSGSSHVTYTQSIPVVSTNISDSVSNSSFPTSATSGDANCTTLNSSTLVTYLRNDQSSDTLVEHTSSERNSSLHSQTHEEAFRTTDNEWNSSNQLTERLLPAPETTFMLPAEPSVEHMNTLQSSIDSARAFQCADFPSYMDQLFRRGIFSAHRPWSLNFCAWFINSVVFEVENRTDHVGLRWGDFRLGQTVDGQTEFIHFVNRVNNRSYYLAASPSSPYGLGLDEQTVAMIDANDPLPVRCPCPVAIFKALRDHRPTSCLEAHSKFYLQPLLWEDVERVAAHRKVKSTSDLEWFTERPWGKNKLGSLFGEAAKRAGLPVICLRKHRSHLSFSLSHASSNCVGDPDVAARLGTTNATTAITESSPSQSFAGTCLSSGQTRFPFTLTLPSTSRRKSNRRQTGTKRRRLSFPPTQTVVLETTQVKSQVFDYTTEQPPSNHLAISRSDRVSVTPCATTL